MFDTTKLEKIREEMVKETMLLKDLCDSLGEKVVYFPSIDDRDTIVTIYQRIGFIRHDIAIRYSTAATPTVNQETLKNATESKNIAFLYADKLYTKYYYIESAYELLF